MGGRQTRYHSLSVPPRAQDIDIRKVEEVKDGYDVVVMGAGNAALCAAIAARDRGASVLVLEKAPEYFRGGNTYFTGGIIRCAYEGMEDIKALVPDMSSEEEQSVDVGSYNEDAFYNDLMRVTAGHTDPELAQLLVSRSHPTLVWLREKGVRFVLSFGRQAFKVGDRYRFWGGLVVEAVGAGKGLSDQQFEVAERNGVDIVYGTKGLALLQDAKGKVSGLRVQGPDGFREVPAAAVVLASGGFEANAEMRARYLGPGWELAKVRGIPYNTGDGIRAAMDVGAQPHGHWSSCHAVAWDLNAPAFGDRTVTELYQKHSYPFGLIVNVNGDRFVDEGADFRNYTYVTYGREILHKPQGVAFQIFDDKVKHLLRDEYHIPQVTMAEAGSIEELADPSGHRPRRAGPHRGGLQRGGPGRRVQPHRPGWKRHVGHRASQDQLGASHRHATLPGVRGHLRHHVYLRRAEDQRPGRGTGLRGNRHTRPLRGGRAGGRTLLLQLPGRVRADGGCSLRQDRRRQCGEGRPRRLTLSPFLRTACLVVSQRPC